VPKAGYVLLTGPTGLLGRYLLAELLAKGRRVAVVARPDGSVSAEQRIEDQLRQFESRLGTRLPRPVVLQGDVALDGLGLAWRQIDWIRRHCDVMLHNAALLQFQEDASGEPWRTNFDGTRHALDVARRARIDHLHYVSTAYVCGWRDGVVRENELDCQQKFRNDYEASKFHAEMAVRKATDEFASVTVYRPAVIAGDSQTGYTSTYHGLFVYLRLMALLVPHQPRDARGVLQTPIRLPFAGDERRNVVPVDWVSRVMLHLVDTPAAWGNTFHLAPNDGLTPRQLIAYCCEYFNSTGVEFVGNGWGQPAAVGDFAERFFEISRVYNQYDLSDPVFDLTNLRRFAGQIPCPVLDRDVIHRFLRFGERDQWGKRRRRSSPPPFPSDKYVAHVAAAASQLKAERRGNGRAATDAQRVPDWFGLDVIGQGGGQWQFRCSGTSFECEPGLPDQSAPIARIDSDRLAQVAAGDNGHVDVARWTSALAEWLAQSAKESAIRTVA